MAAAVGLSTCLHFLRAYAPEKSAGQPGHYKILEDIGAAYRVYRDFITDFSDIPDFDYVTVLITLCCWSDPQPRHSV